MIILKRKNYTSIGWKLKKPIGRARKAVAESLVKSSKKNDKNITSISAKLKESSRVDNPELEEKLKKRIMEDGITISNGPRNSYVKSTRTIRYNSGGAETLAHEYGHALGDIHNLPSRQAQDKFKDADFRSLSPITSKERDIIAGHNNQLIHPLHNLSIGEFHKYAEKSKSTKSAVKKGIKFIRAKRAMNNEEVAATKRGLSVMKDLGATDEELRVAEKNLGLAKKTYDQSFWGGVKKHAANIIQIPSRRA